MTTLQNIGTALRQGQETSDPLGQYQAMEEDFLGVLARGVRVSVRVELVEVGSLMRVRLTGDERVQVSLRRGGDVVGAD